MISRPRMSRPRKAISRLQGTQFGYSARPTPRSTRSSKKRKVDSVLLVPSPISGRVVARSAAPGFLTQPGNAPAPYAVADLSTMWMIANVIETDAPAYKLGQEVEVTVPAYPDTVFKGRVTTLGSIIDPNTHRQLVRSRNRRSQASAAVRNVCQLCHSCRRPDALACGAGERGCQGR